MFQRFERNTQEERDGERRREVGGRAASLLQKKRRGEAREEKRDRKMRILYETKGEEG